MKKEPLFVALSNQKGGVGKSTLTVLLASYFHYHKAKNVLVVDCDYPQHSMMTLREWDIKMWKRPLVCKVCWWSSSGIRAERPTISWLPRPNKPRKLPMVL